MASNKYVKGHKEKVAILEAYYSNAEKIHHVAILLTEVLEELGRRGFNIKTIRSVIPEECTDGEWTFENWTPSPRP
ncbi:MAG TPA: hypothetical protein EYN66_14450 [Myxococcales bacterium]|nr:hypothetical protein [Myxococcales bacterium]